MGWNNIFQVEINKFCQKVLNKNFPETKKYFDIKEFNGNEYKGTIDVISGGFPCQPFSVAGQQKGKDDDRYLWEEMLRVVGEIKPSYVVCENVTGIIGMALDTVLSDLEAQGYTTETFIIPACAVNAPHRRNRVWVIAYSKKQRLEGEQPAWDTSTNGCASKYDFNSAWVEVASEFCRVVNGLPNRVDRIKGLGNAIVPQVAFELFKAIQSVHRQRL